MKNNIVRGRMGEDIAANYLVLNGYRILDRNYRTKLGEIDIIAMISQILVFIEVKSRTSIDYGYPYEAVDWRKRNRILKSSFIYMKHKKLEDYQIRYDIVEVYFRGEPKINHIEDAFCR